MYVLPCLMMNLGRLDPREVWSQVRQPGIQESQRLTGFMMTRIMDLLLLAN